MAHSSLRLDLEDLRGEAVHPFQSIQQNHRRQRQCTLRGGPPRVTHNLRFRQELVQQQPRVFARRRPILRSRALPFHGARPSTTSASHADTPRYLPTHARIADGGARRRPFTPAPLPDARLLDGPAARRRLLPCVVPPAPARAARVAPARHDRAAPAGSHARVRQAVPRA